MALMVVHEWWGLNDHIKAEADRLFEELDGQVHVIAVDMYHGEVATTRNAASNLMQSVNAEYGEAVIKGAAGYLPEEARIATIGWCFGGSWSLQASIALGEQAMGCVMYYGMPEGDSGRLEPLNCSVLGIFAGKDAWITKEVIEEFDFNMKKVGKDLTYKIFEEADHAFANPSRDIYDAAAAEEANTMAREFLRSRLLQE